MNQHHIDFKKCLVISALTVATLSSSAAIADSNFRDGFNWGFDSSIWMAREGSNGTPFGCTFTSNKITPTSQGITLLVGDNECSELQTYGFYSYGRIQGGMKTGNVPGTVSSIFTYTSQHDVSGRAWQEIDIEFLPSRGNVVHTNVIYQPVNGAYQSWEQDIDLGQYGLNIKENLLHIGFDWSSWKIEWYVYDSKGDYKKLRTVYIDNGDGYVAANEIPPYAWPKDPARIMINHWNGDNSSDAQYFPGNYSGQDTWAYYDYLEYVAH